MINDNPRICNQWAIFRRRSEKRTLLFMVLSKLGDVNPEIVKLYKKIVTRRNQLLTTSALVLTSKILSKDLRELLVKTIIEK